MFSDVTNCSYSDDEYEYRHVQLPKAMLKAIPKDYHASSKGTLKLLWEDEWRAMGITQVGWNLKRRTLSLARILTDYRVSDGSTMRCTSQSPISSSSSE